MALNVNSKAAAVGSAVKNQAFAVEGSIVPRKILIIGTYDPAKTLVVDEVPVQIFSPEDAGDQFGYGYMIHRLAVQAFAGSNGVETWVVPQAETGGTQAIGDITFVGTITTAGTVQLYIAGIAVPFTVAVGDDMTAIATACVAAITADNTLPITATNTLGAVDIVAKTDGTFGNEISIIFNLGAGQSFPLGLTSAAITAMSTGAGIPDIADALNGLGTGDNANENFNTDVVHGYLLDSGTLDAIEAYVGSGNEFVGLYAKTVARPFRVLTGDVTPGSGGLTAILAVANGRKNDRANGVISVPDSPNHPSEIAALTIGNMARINNNRAEEHYLGVVLSGIWPGDTADRWTSDYDNLDIAVKAGVSPTRVQSGVVTLVNMMTFYHPDSVPVNSNGYASMRNISILQNLLNSVKVNFSREKWQGISIVADTSAVTNSSDREKARDEDSVIGDLVALAQDFASRAWIFESGYTVDNLTVTVRSGTNGFDSVFPVILSGEGGILDTVITFDISTAVLLG